MGSVFRTVTKSTFSKLFSVEIKNETNTCALRFQVAVDRRGGHVGLPSADARRIPLERRGGGNDWSLCGVPEAHVGRRRHLPPQKCQVTCGRTVVGREGGSQRSHGDVVVLMLG